MGTVPDGGNSVQRDEYIPPWRKDATIDSSLAKYCPAKRGDELSPQAEKYIMTGEKT